MSRPMLRYLLFVRGSNSEAIVTQNGAVIVKREGTLDDCVMWDEPVGGNPVVNPLITNVQGEALAYLDELEQPLVDLYVSDNGGLAYRAGQPGRPIVFPAFVEEDILLVQLGGPPGPPGPSGNAIVTTGTSTIDLSGNGTIGTPLQADAKTPPLTTQALLDAETTARANADTAETAARIAADALLIPKAVGTTAGDLIGYTGPSADVRVPIGSNGQFLTVDLAVAEKVRWTNLPVTGTGITGSGPSNAVPVADSAAGNPGILVAYSRGDHSHPGEPLDVLSDVLASTSNIGQVLVDTTGPTGSGSPTRYRFQTIAGPGSLIDLSNLITLFQTTIAAPHPPGQVVFGEAPVDGSDPLFFWDTANQRLGIGTGTPDTDTALHVVTPDVIRIDRPTGSPSIRMFNLTNPGVAGQGVGSLDYGGLDTAGVQRRFAQMIGLNVGVTPGLLIGAWRVAVIGQARYGTPNPQPVLYVDPAGLFVGDGVTSSAGARLEVQTQRDEISLLVDRFVDGATYTKSLAEFRTNDGISRLTIGPTGSLFLGTLPAHPVGFHGAAVVQAAAIPNAVLGTEAATINLILAVLRASTGVGLIAG